MSAQIQQDPTVIDALGATDPVSVPTKRQLLSSVTAVLGQGKAVRREAKGLGVELLRIGVGRSQVTPARGDGRSRIRPGRTTRSTAGWRRPI